MTSPSYPCSERELHTICRLGWISCGQNLTAFAVFKEQYTAQCITSRLAEVEAIALLPDEPARDRGLAASRFLLTEKTDAGLALWERFKQYVTNAYPVSLQKTKLDAAGQIYLAKAGQYDWENVLDFFRAGSHFITHNGIDLVANQNMPVSFAVAFNAAKVAFETNYQALLNDEVQTNLRIERKIAANNVLHAKLLGLFLDGQRIFRDHEALRKQFNFEQLLSLVSGTKTDAVPNYVATR
ncbi:MAG: hypothetical protein H7Z75_10945 [Ferruginibacter sp.]|nr:hypothetical protein [Cytophagales bacterium]